MCLPTYALGEWRILLSSHGAPTRARAGLLFARCLRSGVQLITCFLRHDLGTSQPLASLRTPAPKLRPVLADKAFACLEDKVLDHNGVYGTYTLLWLRLDVVRMAPNS